MPRPLPRVIAIANQKGGVGKTTTAVNLGACLADLGYRTLVVDLDPQGNASTGLGIDPRGIEHSIYDVLLHGVPMEDIIEASSLRNLFVAPANLDLAGAEIELVPTFSRELRLREAVDSVRDQFDYVLIDCPPSLGLLTVNALVAADTVLIPMQAKYFSLEGLGALQGTIDAVRSAVNPTLAIEGIVFCMFDPRTNLAQQVVKEVRDHFADLVFDTVIPVNIRLSESPSHGKPALLYDIESRGAKAYLQLAREMLSRHERHARADDADPASREGATPS
jgi:chromosome partitioning protein